MEATFVSNSPISSLAQGEGELVMNDIKIQAKSRESH